MGAWRGYIWVNGSMRALGKVEEHAFAINRAGAVVGDFPGGKRDELHAYIWFRDKMVDLAPVAGSWSSAVSINDDGDVAGNYSRLMSMPYGLLWTAKGHNAIALSADVMNVYGISKRNSVVGTVVLGKNFGASRAFLWRAGRLSMLPVPREASSSIATAINANNVVVGYIEIDGRNRPCVWTLGKSLTYKALSPSRGEALAVNNENEIVGDVDNRSDALDHATLWRNGKATDLNSLLPAHDLWQLEVASGINNKGEVVGWGKHNGINRGFLLSMIK
jgi:uncharacterized membrane protein